VEFQPKDAVFMPSLDRLFVVGSTSFAPATSGASDGFLDRYTSGALKRDGRVRICSGAQRLAADDANERLIVSCVRALSSGPQQQLDFETKTLIVDARRLTIIATVPMAPTLGAPGFALDRDSIVIKKNDDPDYLTVDAASGRTRSTVSAPGSYGANVPHFVMPRTAGQPVAAFDLYGNAVSFFSGDSITHVFIGAERLPLDGAFGDDVLYVAEWSPGALALVDYATGEVRRVVPAGFEASDVAFDDVGRSVYVLSESDDGSRCELHRLSPTGDFQQRFELSAEPCTDRLPPPFSAGQHALVIDREARRLYALMKEAIVVFDLAHLRTLFTVQMGFGQNALTTSVAFDTRRGGAYQTIAAEHGFLRHIPLNGGVPPVIVGAEPTIVSGYGGIASIAELGPLLADRTVPVREDAPGLRSPVAAASDGAGTLVVAESSAPTLSRFSHGSYEPYDGLATHSPASPAFDGLGNLWFEDVLDRSTVTLNMRTPDGEQRVFPIRDAFVHVRGIASGLLPWFIPDEKGGVWFRYSQASFVRVLPDGSERECTQVLRRPTVMTSLARGRDGVLFTTTDAIGTLRDDCSIEWYANRIKIFASAVAQAPDGTIVTAGFGEVSIFPVSAPRRSVSLFSLVKARALRAGPNFSTALCNPSEVVATAADVAWTVCNERHEIERISFDGKLSAIALPDPSARPTSMVGESDGSLWYVDTARSRIGHVTTGGILSETVI
jgi:streptogramin lyase